MKVLVCGGAGYIGSHTCVALVEAGHDVLVFDNLSNSSAAAIHRVSELVGRPVDFIQGDIRDRDALARAFATGIDAVLHFAALKAVGESCTEPLRYFDNNIAGTICLLQAMQAAGVQRLVFSSSASVYGEPERMPVTEGSALRATHPYGRSKLVIEELVGDVCTAFPAFGAVLLRYVNPVGAHPSGRIGEAPGGAPSNLMPSLTQVAFGARPRLDVFGSDYPTRDGTAVRDYLHVVDLAAAHVRAMEYAADRPGRHVFNLGTGRGHSVLELVAAFEAATGRTVPYQVVGRRPGDIAELWADPSLARDVLGWQAQLGIERMCADAWRWQANNPHGYDAGGSP